MTNDDLTLIVEALREYRLRLPVESIRRDHAESLIVRMVSQLTKREKDDQC